MSNKWSDNCLHLSYCKILINVQILMFVAFAKQHYVFPVRYISKEKREQNIQDFSLGINQT